LSKKILILDYKVGNVDSIIKVINYLGFDTIFDNSKFAFNRAHKIILPGQGSFTSAMHNLISLNIYERLIKIIKKDKIPTLGICLGMQIMGTFGFENEEKTKGLGVVDAVCKKIKSNNAKLPHMGWNEIQIKKKNNLFININNKVDFYFAHSYVLQCKNKSDVVSTTNYGQNFASSINRENIFGVQFHPEKSLKNGIQLLKNFLDYEKN